MLYQCDINKHAKTKFIIVIPIEIFKTFFTIIFGLTLIALTVRSVNFRSYSRKWLFITNIYFGYSFLNIFGITIINFVPLAFLLIIILITRHNNSEFIILWFNGIKIIIVNLLLLSSFIVVIFICFFNIYYPIDT